MLCTFSPCIEQTQRTVEALKAAPHAFVDIRTVEALTRFYDPVYKRHRTRDKDCGANTIEANNTNKNSHIRFRPSLTSKGHSAYLTFARRSLTHSEDTNEDAMDVKT
uniref:tRNA (adenine(58)-N(1))-methyltransferase n=1 Tax=Lygus hesperus TaxID=30085 RepID=A0A0A9XXS1_LYGHE